MATEHRVGAASHASVAAAPGARLKAAREAAGMSLDQVAQQLKLAPRQVKALEEQDFAHLPGRTFTRGFVRNYARLLHLDAGGLLAGLPDADEAPALDRPPLQATGAMIAELPATRARAPGFARWLIPLLLVACVIAAAAYEWYGGGLGAPRETQSAAMTKSEPALQGGVSPQATTTVALPNPLDGAAKSEPPAASTPPSADSTATSAPTAVSAPPTEMSPAPGATASSPTMTEPAPAAIAPPPAEAARTVTDAKPAASEVVPAPLQLTYRASSWTQIRDRTGQILISRTVPAGSEQSIRGTAPFDIVIGNARAVTLVYRGEPVDLARYTHGNIARLRLS